MCLSIYNVDAYSAYASLDYMHIVYMHIVQGIMEIFILECSVFRLAMTYIIGNVNGRYRSSTGLRDST